MMKQISLALVLLFCLVSVVTGCQPSTIIDQTNMTPGISTTPSIAESIATLDVEPGTTNVEAVIQVKGTPVNGANFYLAEILKNQTGEEIAVTTDRETAPHAISTIDGQILFQNVQPGRYGLVLYDGFNIYLLLYPETGLGILIDVEQEVVNLGVIDFLDLPLD